MGAFMSPNITIEFKEGKLYYSYDQFGSSAKRYKERIYTKIIIPSEESWVTFFETFDLLNVEQWSHNTYRDDDVLDSIGWKICIDITFNNDKKEEQYKVNANGYEVVPDGWDAFVKAIEKLIHESITSRTYNAAVLDVFMKDETKGEEKRRILFKKITPMVLEIIEKYININILDYNVREILMKYMQQAQYFAQEQEDIDIFNYFIKTYHGEKNNDILPLTDYFEDVMIRSFVLRGFDIFEKEA